LRATILAAGLGVACGGAGRTGPPSTPPIAAPLPDGVWLITEPLQAGNPWNGVHPGDTHAAGLPIDELESVAGYLEGEGVQARAIGVLWSTRPIAVCAALSCPRGDRLVVVVSARDAGALLARPQWKPVPKDELWGFAPAACEAPWVKGQEEANPTAPEDEAKVVAQWAGDIGSRPEWVGWLYLVEGRDAPSCGQRRPELTIVDPGEGGASALAERGFSPSP
jgi:hypothetical protein